MTQVRDQGLRAQQYINEGVQMSVVHSQKAIAMHNEGVHASHQQVGAICSDVKQGTSKATGRGIIGDGNKLSKVSSKMGKLG